LLQNHADCLLFQCLIACSDRDASQVAMEHWEALTKFVGLNDKCKIPEPFTFDQHVATAQKFRDHLKDDCRQEVCAVCSKYCSHAVVNKYSLADVPHLDLLDAAGPKSAKHPRDALTTFAWHDVTYCLQPYSCYGDGNECQVDMCNDCYGALQSMRVPESSLVCFDTGMYLATVPGNDEETVRTNASDDEY
jgi:hypothetical protein